MNHKMMALWALLLVATGSSAAQLGDTTIVVKNPNRVTVKDTDNSMQIIIEGKEGDPSWNFSRMRTWNQRSMEITKEHTQFDFALSLPGMKQKRRREAMEYHLPTFFIGLSSALNTPSKMDTPVGSAVEIGFTPIACELPQIGRNVGVVAGMGFAWRNYRMSDDVRFLKQEQQVVLGDYPVGASPKFSRIKTFSMTVPLLLEVRTNKLRGGRFWMNMGPMLNISTYGSLKTRYRMNGEKQKEVDKHIHQQPVTVDFYASMGHNDIGVYFRYSPCNVLRTNYGPKFQSMSMGLSIGL